MQRILIIYLFLLGITLPGCKNFQSMTPKRKPLVVVSIPPYVSIVKAIAGNSVTVQSVIPPNFDPHTMEITPNQRSLIQKANLFIGIGESFENKLLPALKDENKKLHILQLNTKLPLLAYATTSNVESCQHTHHHLDHSQDIHFWLSPTLLLTQISLITESLIELQPNSADIYNHRSENLINQVKQLHTKIYKQLLPYQKKAILVPHAAIGYFCHDYNLVQISVECEGKSPLPNEVNQILHLAEHSDIACALTFPQFNNKGLDIIAKKLNIHTKNFDPLAEDVLKNIEQLSENIIE